jgi:SAM-dependent methyltransferase
MSHGGKPTVLDLDACPACGGDAFRSFDLGSGSLLRRCVRCDTISAHTYVDPAEVYVEGYMFGEAGPFGIDAQDPIFQRYLARVADRRMALIERATGVRAGSILDVGAGGGELLAGARARGWRVCGAEPERAAAGLAQSRGIDVRAAMLEDAGFPERSFDVVSAFHVLEHVPHSVPFLRSLARWARPGGFVTVEVPNWRTVQRRRLRERWSALRPGEHLVHFTPRTLRRTFTTAGIVPIAVRSPTYVGPPQNLGHALNDLGRAGGRFRQLVAPFTTVRAVDGEPARYPTRTGWALLRAAEAIHDAAGVGAVVLCVGRVP